MLALRALLESIPQDRTVRFLLGKHPSNKASGEEVLLWYALVERDFQSTLAEVIHRRKLRVFIEKPRDRMKRSELAAHHVAFRWKNYDYSSESPHEHVIYLIDGKVLGIGDAGLDAVLSFLREQPEETVVTMPQYSNTPYKRDVDPDRIPFPSRRREFEQVLKAKRLEIEYHQISPESRYSSDSITDLLSLGRVATERERAKPADAVLSWNYYASQEAEADSEKTLYWLNHAEVGRGMPGFQAAIKQIEALPDGATLRIDPVCIRTKGPFASPIILAGHPHVERTGREPFNSLIALLSVEVKRKKLKVELIPDER